MENYTISGESIKVILKPTASPRKISPSQPITYQIIPSDLIGHIFDCVPSFSHELLRDQISLAKMLWMTTNPRKKHKVHRNMTTFNKDELRSIWGSDQRMREVISNGDYFFVIRGSNLPIGKGFTNAYEPNPQMEDALNRSISDPLPSEWIEYKKTAKRVMRTFPQAIAPFAGHTNSRRTTWAGVSPTNCTRIDIQSLEAIRANSHSEEVRLISSLEEGECNIDHTNSSLQKYIHYQLTASALIKLSKNLIYPGSIPIRYTEQSTGRLFCTGLSLQTVPRPVREAAMAGCWDYDISNCHWSLINDLAAKAGYTCNAILHYLENKSQIRKAIASDVGISVDDAKICLLMTMYGAVRTPWECASIPQKIGIDNARKLYMSRYFEAISKDVASARIRIVKGLPVLKGGWVVNALGIRINGTAAPSEILAHILQGLEAKALRAVVRNYGDNVQLCIHDGWVTRNRLDQSEVAQLITDEIQVAIKIDEKYIEAVKLENPTPNRLMTINKYLTE